MSAYILRRLLLIIPTMIGIMLITFIIVQFAPGGPVERMIAQLTGTDVAAIAKAMEQLTTAQHKAAESLYKQAQPGGGGGGPESGSGGAPQGDGGQGQSGAAKSDVIDAEVVDDK